MNGPDVITYAFTNIGKLKPEEMELSDQLKYFTACAEFAEKIKPYIDKYVTKKEEKKEMSPEDLLTLMMLAAKVKASYEEDEE